MEQTVGSPLSTRDVARRLGVSVRTVHRIAARGQLTATRIAGTFAFDPSEVDALERAR